MEVQEYLSKLNASSQYIDLANRGIIRSEGVIDLLKRFAHLRKLSLRQNKLKYIAKTIESLSSLEELDLSDNPFENEFHSKIHLSKKLSELCIPLSRMNNLRSLQISLEGDDEEDFILDQLPHLEQLNQKPIERAHDAHDSFTGDVSKEQTNKNFNEFECFKKENLEEATVVFQDLQDLLKEKGVGEYQESQQQFKNQVSKIVIDLRERNEKEPDPQLKKLVQLKQKYSIYELCFSKAIEYSEQIDQRFFESLASIHDFHAIVFKQMSKIIQDQSKTIEAQRQKAPQVLSSATIQNVKELEDQIESLQKENKKYLEKIIRLSKGENPLKDQTQYKLNQSKNEFNSSPKGISVGSTKNLTLNQLKEIIHEIYASKEWFDTKEQNRQHLPPQTMEMHMYEYLTQKYGLKSIVIEQASTIIYAIKKMTSEDNDVAVFTKILKNECDENFRFVQGQLKRTIKELLSMHLKGKFPLKNTNELKVMVEQKTNSMISLEEASDIISYMYNKDDSRSLMDQMKDYVLNSQLSPPLTQIKKGQRRDEIQKEVPDKNKLLYSCFERIVLDFQLRSHERFLRPFCQLFKKFDLDQDGVISEDEFRSFISSLGVQIFENDVERYLKILDPFTLQTITFSQIVNLFSEEMINIDSTQMSILQHLSLNLKNH